MDIDTAAWNLPDTDICSAAMRLVIGVSPAYLANHCARSYLFARELAAAQGIDYDEELVFLACVLHDLGLTGHGDGNQRFEVDGADAAARFLQEHGLAEHRRIPVWQAIALHTSVGLAHRFGPVQAVAFGGISLDINGFGSDVLPTGFADRVHAAWPRHDLGFAIAAEIARGTLADPDKAPPFSFPAHIHQIVNGPSVTFPQMVHAAPWGDRPAALEQRC
ncbi:HD domain-containing protein [Mycobacterium sp. AMU20-3851]|uniref:HD domain-containing protein n=1 Tax=Mycobacterium sp. AMU20-3851 TaxID=3122055 RepID=UPI003754AA6A